ncbi:MAG: efflux RND transporter permease subunit, partial [Lentisphaeria bacterium]|nr:efflux RND transporter permease subunit [Lentisphaeria bacterium]
MLSEFFINRPRFAFVISLLLLLGGIIALFSLPVTLYPDIAPSQIEVTANYPGADAQTVMDTVIQPIESQLNGVKDMIYMSSTAAEDGSAAIKVYFNIGTDGDRNTVNTQNRVAWAESSLPQDVQRQGITTKEASSSMLAIVTLYSPTGAYDEKDLSNFMSIYIKDELARIPGVGDVNQMGALTYAMRVWLDNMRMASLGITVDDVRNAISAQNVQISAGSLGEWPAPAGQKTRFAVTAQGRMTEPEEFGAIVIRSRSDGSQIRLRDIAKVEMGAENYSGVSSLNGKPAAMLAVYQRNNANGLEIAKNIRQRLEEIKKTSFPNDLAYGVQYDTTKFIKASISEVAETLYVAVLLVVLVTYLFLQDWRATLVPSVAIPVSLVGTFAVLYAVGFSINLVTLFGLILAIGVVVDDAIVVIESVSRLMEEEGLSARDAAVKTMRQVTGPCIATTLVLLAMFVPVCFLSGITGVMYRQFGITISVAVSLSTLNALTLSPALCALILKPVDRTRKKFIFFRWFDAMFDWMTAKYGAIVRSLVSRSLLVIVLYAAMGFGAVELFKMLPTGFVPDEDQGTFFVNVQLPDGASLDRTEEVVARLREAVKDIPEVRDYMFVSGFNLINNVSASNCALGVVMLKDWSERKGESQVQDAVMERFYESIKDIPGASVAAFGSPTIQGLGAVSGFSMMLQDRSNSLTPTQFQQKLNKVLAEANSSPVLSTVYSSFRASSPQVYLPVDRGKAMKLGVSVEDISRALEGTFGYTYVNDFNKYGKTYKVEYQSAPEYRNEVSDITHVYLRNSSGNMVPLSTLVEPEFRFVPQYLQRFNMYQAISINGAPAAGYSSGQAMAEMERIVHKVDPSLSFEWADMSYQEKLAGNQVVVVFALALLFIYL